MWLWAWPVPVRSSQKLVAMYVLCIVRVQEIVRLANVYIITRAYSCFPLSFNINIAFNIAKAVHICEVWD